MPSATCRPHADPKLHELLAAFGIDLVLDVGANTGEFARELFAAGYEGRIVSFEPLSRGHRALLAASAGNANWILAERCALGARRGEQLLHIAGNLESSSLLEILPSHVRSAPRSKYVDSELVSVIPLDEIAHEYVETASAPFLKIDVQGFEEQVLQGATTTLPKVKGLQLEMSLIPLYEGAPLFESLLARAKSLGFELWWLTSGFTDPETGRLLQLDGIFFHSQT
jgi:FkbM family methyltransferase